MTGDGFLNGLSWLYWLHCLAASGLMLYGVNCYVMLAIHRRATTAMAQQGAAPAPTRQPIPPSYPQVTVQLPVYNERYVLQRLVEAVTRLDYPRHCLEIQILDDSTDTTTLLAAQLVAHYRQQGFRITLQHRQQRAGYKAGALAEGLQTTTGEFIAIFDADFVPQPDFLQQTLPWFAERCVGMVQARWGHLNRTYSLLTLAQSFGIDGHFWVEQTARNNAGWFMNFNGSGGIWRRTAIDDSGGWQGDTLTEDLDLSYRAQLRGWRLQFAPQVVCPAEVPVQMSGVKSQQHRWAKGSIQTALKLLPRVLRSHFSLGVKYQAVMHLTNYLVHPFMLCLALTTPLLLLQQGGLYTAPVPVAFLALVAMAVATCGPMSLYLYAQQQLYTDWHRRPLALLTLMILGTGIAASNTRAVLEALCRIQSAFVRTPKFHIERGVDTWRGKQYFAAFSWSSLAEILLMLYSAYGVSLAWSHGVYGLLPFQGLYTLGFAGVAGLSLWEYAQHYLWPPPPSVDISMIVPPDRVPFLKDTLEERHESH